MIRWILSDTTENGEGIYTYKKYPNIQITAVKNNISIAIATKTFMSGGKVHYSPENGFIGSPNQLNRNQLKEAYEDYEDEVNKLLNI